MHGGTRRGQATRRIRLPADRRRELIVAEAVRYFARHGWQSGTAGLARRLGVSQPLLYRYYPSKRKLIEAVYDRVFVFGALWHERWAGRLADRAVPLRRRLTEFYAEYAARVLTRDYCRLSMHAALAGYRPGVRYVPFLRQQVFPAVVRELRALRGEAAAAGAPVSDAELEVAMSLHAAIYHLAVRRWIYSPPLRGPIARLVAAKVDLFLDGAAAAPAALSRAA